MDVSSRILLFYSKSHCAASHCQPLQLGWWRLLLPHVPPGQVRRSVFSQTIWLRQVQAFHPSCAGAIPPLCVTTLISKGHRNRRHTCRLVLLLEVPTSCWQRFAQGPAGRSWQLCLAALLSHTASPAARCWSLTLDNAMIFEHQLDISNRERRISALAGFYRSRQWQCLRCVLGAEGPAPRSDRWPDASTACLLQS